MPLKILKKSSKEYKVVSKSMFVIKVDLLDNGTLECTLDSESLGRDCLLNISQRLGIFQPEYFGLSYISRGQRWVELDKPLKKQLDRYAEEPSLSMGVLFYISDVNLLTDEMARYHYFLQLKYDVIEGKLNCTIDQAISLAAYSLQAEFGDFDPQRQTNSTIEYLKEFAILPKDLTLAEKYIELNVDTLYEIVARQYGNLNGFPPPLSEIYYIMMAMGLDGYGQEIFSAKENGTDILLCVSLKGIIIRNRNWTHEEIGTYFRWNDIKTLTRAKGLLTIETESSSISNRTLNFTEEEVSKYVRMYCLLIRSFYKDNMENSSENRTQHHHRMPEGIYSHTSLNLRGIIENNPISSKFKQSPRPSLNTLPTCKGDILENAIRQNLISLHPSLSSEFQVIQSNNGNKQHQYYSSGYMSEDHRGSPSASNSNSNSTSNLSNQNSFISSKNNPMSSSCSGSGGISSFTHSQLMSFSEYQQKSKYNQSNSNSNINAIMENINSLGNKTINPTTIQNLLPPYRAAPDYFTYMKYHHSQDVNYYDAASSGNYEESEPIYENQILSQMSALEINENHNLPSRSLKDSKDNQILPQYMCRPPPPYPGNSNNSTSTSSSQDKNHILSTYEFLPASSSSTLKETSFHQLTLNPQSTQGPFKYGSRFYRSMDRSGSGSGAASSSTLRKAHDRDSSKSNNVKISKVDDNEEENIEIRI